MLGYRFKGDVVIKLGLAVKYVSIKEYNTMYESISTELCNSNSLLSISFIFGTSYKNNQSPIIEPSFIINAFKVIITEVCGTFLNQTLR